MKEDRPELKLVILESPFAGHVEQNTAYLRDALRDSLMRGEAPFASHRLYTEALDDTNPREREQGIEAGLAWGRVAQKTVVYADLGVSKGMKLGVLRAIDEGRPVEVRFIRPESRGLGTWDGQRLLRALLEGVFPEPLAPPAQRVPRTYDASKVVITFTESGSTRPLSDDRAQLARAVFSESERVERMG